MLSDPQERSWYDSHRSIILSGRNETAGAHYEHNVRVTTADDLMRLFARFTGEIDFSDASNGFYGVLCNTFETLAKEERMACDWEGLEPIDYPSFGHADDSYEDIVRPFYAAWNGFATKKTFSWMDVFRTSDAQDRRSRRTMEKENRKFRNEGVRKFNDTVRQLVAFARKRDPRYKQNVPTDAERQKINRDAANAQAARSKAANRAKMAEKEKVAEWATHHEMTAETIDEGVQESEEEPEKVFECVVCCKVFKSEKQLDAHEKSRKHIKAVDRLRKDMRGEAKALDLDNGASSAISTPAEKDDEDVSSIPGYDGVVTRGINEIDTSKPEGEAVASDLSGTDRTHQVIDSELLASPNPSSASSTDDEYASREKVEERFLGSKCEKGGRRDDDEHLHDLDRVTNMFSKETLDGNRHSSPSRKAGKAKEKRAKKAAQATELANAEVCIFVLSLILNTDDWIQFKCATCNAAFPSRTRLFSHIQDFGHARPVPQQAKGGKGKKR